MKRLFHGAALFVAMASAVWLGVLWRWQTTRREMDAEALLLYLGVLPVAAFVLLLAARWAVRGALAKQSVEAAAAAGAPPGAATGDDPNGEPVGERPMPWHLRGAWVHTAGGSSVQALMAALEAGAPRPAPHPELVDGDGLPVMTARILDVDTDSVANALQRQAARSPADTQTGRHADALSERALRALAILSPLVDELLQALQEGGRPSYGGVSSAPSARSSPAPIDDGRATARLLAAWPTDWDDATCASAEAWLRDRLCDPLAAGPAPIRSRLRAQRMSGAELLTAAAQALESLRAEGRVDTVALLACHSDLDGQGIQDLETRLSLFQATRRPKVAIAGEGAAVLLLSAVAAPLDGPIPADSIRLASPVLLERADAIEASGRQASEDTIGLVRLGLARAGVSDATVAKLASDADQHTARANELYAVTLALMPGRDANDDFRLAGTLTGRLEAAAPLVTIACAAALAGSSGQPAIALSLADSHWRMVAVLTPDGFQAAPA